VVLTRTTRVTPTRATCVVPTWNDTRDSDEAASERLDELATALEDDLLARDADVMTKLAENIRVGEERCMGSAEEYGY